MSSETTVNILAMEYKSININVFPEKIIHIFFLVLIVYVCSAKELTAKVIFVSEKASGDDNGSSWENAFRNLQDALANANNGDEIWVAEGTYRPDRGGGNSQGDFNISFSLKSEVAIYGGFSEGESQLAQRDFLSNETILSGDLNQDDNPDNANTRLENSVHVVESHGNNSTAILDGFVITSGDAVIPSDSRSEGGGIRIENGSPTIRNCTFRHNHAIKGGAIYLSSNPTIEHCMFTDNRARLGGAIYNHSNTMTISSCTFQSNAANLEEGQGGFAGGAIYNDSTTITVNSCIFESNTSRSEGGAMFNSQSSMVIADNCVFNSNIAFSSGGGIFSSRSEIQITNSNFKENSGFDTGGGMSNFETNKTFIDRCVFDSNTSNQGGGIHSFGPSSEFTIVNCEFLGNKTQLEEGGGIYSFNDGKLTIQNCLFDSNTADNEGGGAFIESPNQQHTFTNSVFIKNNASNGGGLCLDGKNSSEKTISFLFTNCIFSENMTTGHGGGVRGFNSSANFVNCSFWKNSAGGQGGGIAAFDTSPFAIINSILSGNLSTLLPETSEVSLPANDYSVIDSIIKDLGDREGNIDEDPKFVLDLDRIDLDGPDDKFWTADDGLRIQADSPARDAGSLTEAPSTDILGVPRPQGNGVDIGAYEYFDPIKITVNISDDQDGLVPEAKWKIISDGEDVSDFLVSETVFTKIIPGVYSLTFSAVPGWTEPDGDTITLEGGANLTLPFKYRKILFPLRVNQGWNLISIPIEPLNTSVETVLPGVSTRSIWEWTGTTLMRSTNIHSKKAYWIYIDKNDPNGILIHGTEVIDTSIPLSNQWNAIGPISDIHDYPPKFIMPGVFDPETDITSPIWYWNGKTFGIAKDVLVPGNGYFVIKN